jgi:hypothetical protein
MASYLVSRDPVEYTKRYCEKNNIPISDVLADPPYSTYAQLRLVGVPFTVIVGPNGVERVWRGRLTPQAISEFRRLFLA